MVERQRPGPSPVGGLMEITVAVTVSFQITWLCPNSTFSSPVGISLWRRGGVRGAIGKP